MTMTTRALLQRAARQCAAACLPGAAALALAAWPAQPTRLVTGFLPGGVERGNIRAE